MRKQYGKLFESKESGPGLSEAPDGWSGKIGKRIFWFGLALAIATLVIYSRAGNHQFVYDDEDYILNNPLVITGISSAKMARAFISVHSSNWHPITWLSHMADVQLYGLNPRGHHYTNIAFHIAASLLLLVFLFRTTGAFWRSAFVSAIFALHPMHVESVAWVAERKDVLSAFFGFLALIFYAEYRSRHKRSYYYLSLSTFMLGLMSKPMLVSFPIVLLLVDFWPLGRHAGESGPAPGDWNLFRRVFSLLHEKKWFCFWSLLSCLFTILVQDISGSTASFKRVPLALRVDNALIAYCKYIIKAFWPTDLGVLYPLRPSFPMWQVLLSFIAIVLISSAVIHYRQRFPYLLTGWFWFLITLIPVIGLIQVGSQAMADRYSYIPYVGLSVMVAWGCADLVVMSGNRAALLGAALFVIPLIACATVTWVQLGYWQDNLSLYRHTLQVTERNETMHYNLGNVYRENGFYDSAINEYREALLINAKADDTHNNLGLALSARGNIDEAIQEYRKSLEINPYKVNTLNQLGTELVRKGDSDAALQCYRKALQLNPNYPDPHLNIGLILVGSGNLDSAQQEFQVALHLDPQLPDAHYNLGRVFEIRGDPGAAAKEYQNELQLNPNHVKALSALENALRQKRMP